MDDLISRQAAIDALAEDMPQPYTPDGSHPADEGIFMAQEIYAECIETIEILPSAQPEIIFCKDCKHWYLDADTGMACEFTNMGQPEDGFCNWAERRQDE